MAEITVKPSKGNFLLFTVMNAAGFNDNNGYERMHPLREKTRLYFAREINNPAVLGTSNVLGPYMREHSYCSEADIQSVEFGFSPSQDQRSASIRGLLEQFRGSTDFDNFYRSISLELEVICQEARNQFQQVPFLQIMRDAHEIDPHYNFFIIPSPLDKVQSGHGPLIGNNALSISAPRSESKDSNPTFNHPSLRKIAAHEFSHSYCDIHKQEFYRLLKERGFTEQRLSEFFKTLKTQDYQGSTVIEETFIRALQARYINPFLEIENKESVEQALIDEHERHGFEHIFIVDAAIQRHKRNPRGSLTSAVAEVYQKLIVNSI